MGNLFFIFLLLIDQLVRLADMLIVRSVPTSIVVSTIIFYMPSFLVLTIPISTLFATLLAFSRFSSDSELIAMQACGASNRTLFTPVVIFGIFAALLGIYFSTVLMPKGSMMAMGNLNKVLENLSVNDIRAKEMYADIPGLIFYANKKLDTENFNEVIVINTHNKAIIAAQKGSIVPNAGKSLNMSFEGGKFTMADYRDNYTSLNFEKMLINIPTNVTAELMPMNERFMNLTELKSKFQEAPIYRYEYIKRFTMPLSTIIMAVFGVLLGIFSQRSGRSFGVVIACVIAFGMNVMYIVGESFVSKYNPTLLGCLPIAVLSVILAVVWIRRFA
jgi:lipopolysaccharide export system permease protein